MAAKALSLLSFPSLSLSSTSRIFMRHKGSKGRAWIQRIPNNGIFPEEISAKPPRSHPSFPEAKEGHIRKKAFLDLKVGDKPLGRVVLELADDIVPKTVENFVKLCCGETGYGYKGTSFHVVRKGFIAQGGDFENEDGTGGKSAFSEKFFEDENFFICHSERGIISMANCGADRNASQFFITFSPCNHLDGYNVAFGKVFEGHQVLDSLEKVYTKRGKPITPVVISDSGQV